MIWDMDSLEPPPDPSSGRKPAKMLPILRKFELRSQLAPEPDELPDEDEVVLRCSPPTVPSASSSEVEMTVCFLPALHLPRLAFDDRLCFLSTEAKSDDEVEATEPADRWSLVAWRDRAGGAARLRAASWPAALSFEVDAAENAGAARARANAKIAEERMVENWGGAEVSGQQWKPSQQCSARTGMKGGATGDGAHLMRGAVVLLSR